MPITGRPLNQLDLWPNYDQRYPNEDALIVGKKSTNPKRFIGQSFAQFVRLGPFEASDGLRKVGTYYLFLGKRRPLVDH